MASVYHARNTIVTEQPNPGRMKLSAERLSARMPGKSLFEHVVRTVHKVKITALWLPRIQRDSGNAALKR